MDQRPLYIFYSLGNFHSLEVVDRVSETQLQVGENAGVDFRCPCLEPILSITLHVLFYSFGAGVDFRCPCLEPILSITLHVK